MNFLERVIQDTCLNANSLYVKLKKYFNYEGLREEKCSMNLKGHCRYKYTYKHTRRMKASPRRESGVTSQRLPTGYSLASGVVTRFWPRSVFLIIVCVFDPFQPHRTVMIQYLMVSAILQRGLVPSVCQLLPPKTQNVSISICTCRVYMQLKCGWALSPGTFFQCEQF